MSMQTSLSLERRNSRRILRSSRSPLWSYILYKWFIYCSRSTVNHHPSGVGNRVQALCHHGLEPCPSLCCKYSLFVELSLFVMVSYILLWYSVLSIIAICPINQNLFLAKIYALHFFNASLVLWPPNAKNWPTRKDPGAGEDWRQKEKGTTEVEMVE